MPDKKCSNCKANMDGLCLMLGCPTLLDTEIADNFECEYWEEDKQWANTKKTNERAEE